MSQRTGIVGRVGLDSIGLKHHAVQHWNLHPPALIAHALAGREGRLCNRGSLVALTGPRTGRSPRDKFVVREPSSERHIAWGDVNRPIDTDVFTHLQSKAFSYLGDKPLYVQDLWAGAHPSYRLNVRIITEFAWHSLFARQLFVRPPAEALTGFQPDFTVINAARCTADPARDKSNSEAFILVNFGQKRVVIGGTQYAGEIKKSIFTVMNYVLPLQGVFPMHCSANIGAAGDTALFFGLSGTGKTTLSADPNRRLIGDDEHGWSDEGVFNFEGGCYAKVINLSAEFEPQIHNAIRFGSVLENVVLDPHTHACDYTDGSITENTRGAYPLDFIANAVQPAIGGHPKNVVFLTCDAHGVLPPIMKLSREQAMYHFLAGYTAKVAGTEAGVGNEPQATFSTCFGAPFMPLAPSVYAELLGQRTAKHSTRTWLVNTGWSGGPFGIGQRMKLPHTRAILTAALSGALDEVAYRPHPVFRGGIPAACPGVPVELLDPRNTWKDAAAYDRKAAELAGLFSRNFEKFAGASAEVRAAGPSA